MRKLIVGLLGAATVLLVPAGNAWGASSSASCAGQFFSSHAGIVPATGGEESVGGFVSGTAQELRSDFGQEISRGARIPTRSDCGL